jgi:SAM-dependent methyltransferase
VKYFRNTELAKLYNVSEKSVRNWIQAAQEGKIELQLYKQSDRSWVANTSKNTFLIEQLAKKGKKYKNKRSFKAISPNSSFYETYSHKQVLDIISNLSIHNEIPLQYSYVDGGAKYWNQYASRLASEETPNVLTKTIELLDASFNNIEGLLSDRKWVNVVDLGPGNGIPIRGVLTRLMEQGRLKRYIAIDSSKEMLQILEQNIKSWFGNEVKFEGYIRDFSHERFDDILADDYADDDSNVPASLVFLLGGTLSNFKSPSIVLQAVNSSLGLNDLLIYSDKLDTPNTRRYFDFNISAVEQKLTPRHRLILDYLNVNEAFYDVEQTFDEQKRARSISIIPRMDLTVIFNTRIGTRQVELRKNNPVLLWRAWGWDTMQLIRQFDRNGFDLMQLLRSKDEEYILVISKLRINQ